MSVIVKDINDGKIKLICKGADFVIKDRLKDSIANKDIFRETNRFLEDYAKSGLRTLVLAQREISEEEYINWEAQYIKASCAIKNREQMVDEIAEKIEINLDIIGSTAIEDLL